jgi:Arc/MetJ-type ribon-helix-helix transcriptional regulator
VLRQTIYSGNNCKFDNQSSVIRTGRRKLKENYFQDWKKKQKDVEKNQ